MHATRFFLNDTATTEIYTLSLHDALPISTATGRCDAFAIPRATNEADRSSWRTCRRVRSSSNSARASGVERDPGARDRKSTSLNSSHANILYAVFCLEKKDSQTVPPPRSV